MKKIASLILVLVLALSVFVGCGNAEKDYSLSIGVKTTEALASSKVTQSIAAIVIDADGKIVECTFDCVDYTAYKNGALVETTPASKLEQGDAYDAYMPMKAGRWYQQTEALAASLIGKTQAEVAAIALTADGKLTDAELTASCSIAVSDLLTAVDNAFKCEYKQAFKSSADDLAIGLSAVSKVTAADTSAKISSTYEFTESSNYVTWISST